jgi:hypothetical protein
VGLFEYKAKKNKVPGAGTYKNVEAAFDKIARSSPRMTTKRH